MTILTGLLVGTAWLCIWTATDVTATVREQRAHQNDRRGWCITHTSTRLLTAVAILLAYYAGTLR